METPISPLAVYIKKMRRLSRVSLVLGLVQCVALAPYEAALYSHSHSGLNLGFAIGNAVFGIVNLATHRGRQRTIAAAEELHARMVELKRIYRP